MRRVMRDAPTERLREIDALLDAALDRPAHERAAFLDQACGGDASLRAWVQRLLDAHDAPDDFLEQPGLAFAAPLVRGSDVLRAPAPERVGPFRVIREIGHGGMGAVFLAARDDGQFAQRVALKLIRQLGAKDLVPRFLEERRILALLEHPHIARLVDGGVTSDGVPWFAMEYVDGEPIDRYCDAGGLSMEARLELFASVCDVVQYAHEHFVIHRDLKPSNILVAGDGQLKLLDFGVAKLIGQGAPSAELAATPPTVQPMTPEYAAPEQVRGDHVSAATDVYALGILLYLLLTGRRPYEVRGRSPAEVERIICELGPEPPSSAVAAHDTARHLALRGDLDTIVMKALNKEPDARYRSAQELLQDVRRHLSGHPVLARRQTIRYRAQRFVRRHRIETFAALAISLSLIVGSVLALAQARRAGIERDRAEIASRETVAINGFLLQLFETSDPSDARADTLTARQLVDRAATRVDHLEGDPLQRARLLEVVSRLYTNLGQYESARDAIERALAFRRSGNGSSGGDLETADLLLRLSKLFISLSRFAEGDSAAREALAIQEQRLGANDPALAYTLHQLASAATYRGNLTAAEEFGRRALDARVRTLGADDSLTVQSRFLLGGTLRREGKLGDAEHEFREGIEMAERARGRDDPQVAMGCLLLADLLTENEGRAAEAKPLYYRALEIRRRVYGDADPNVAYAMADLASFLSYQGDTAAAISIAREYLARLQRTFGANHPVVLAAITQSASVLARVGAKAEAESLFRRAIELSRNVRGADHTTVAGNESDLARLLIQRGEFGEAHALLRDAIRIADKTFGVDHPITARMHGVNGLLLLHERRYAAADTALRPAVEKVERRLGRASPMARELYGWLADLEDARQHHADAARYRAIATAR